MEIFLKAIIFAGALQGFFLALLIFKNIELKKTNKFFLISILIFFSFNIIFNELIQIIAKASPDFIITTGSFQLFLGPMIYYYVRSLTENKFKHKCSDLFHFIPMFLYFIFIIIIHIWQELIPSLAIMNKIMWGFIIIQFSLYLFAVRKKVLLFDKNLKENFSSIEKINLKWLNFFLLSLFFLLFLYFILFIIIMTNFENTIINKLLSLFLSFFIYLFGYKGMQQKPVPIEKNENKNKYSKSLLPPEYSEFWKNKLLSFLEKEKPFLNSDLSLALLAENLGLPINQLSQIINNNLNTTFYDLINQYRIEEVKRLLISNNEKSILDLAFESGFNSKTTFNVFFKKKTCFTPSQYKNLKK